VKKIFSGPFSWCQHIASAGLPRSTWKI